MLDTVFTEFTGFRLAFAALGLVWRPAEFRSFRLGANVTVRTARPSKKRISSESSKTAHVAFHKHTEILLEYYGSSLFHHLAR